MMTSSRPVEEIIRGQSSRSTLGDAVGLEEIDEGNILIARVLCWDIVSVDVVSIYAN